MNSRRVENPNQSNNEMRAAGKARMGVAGAQTQAAANTTYTINPAEPHALAGAGNPPRGGTG